MERERECARAHARAREIEHEKEREEESSDFRLIVVSIAYVATLIVAEVVRSE